MSSKKQEYFLKLNHMKWMYFKIFKQQGTIAAGCEESVINISEQCSTSSTVQSTVSEK